MRHQEGTFPGVRGSDIFYQAWLPEGEVKSAVLIVHGLAEHSGRYGNVVHHLVPRGHAVYGFDLPGHGRSPGTRVYVERFEDYTTTLRIFQSVVQDWHADRRLYLLGHSMGGLVVPYGLLSHQDGLSGAILSAPSVSLPDNVTAFTILLGRVLSRLVPKAGLMAIDAEAVSRDPAVVQAYDTDPLVYRGKTTARLGAELLRALQQVNTEAGRIQLPLLIVQGADDHLVDPKGAQALFDVVGSQDKTLKIYPGLYHEVFNEPEREQVLADVAAWLEERL